VFCKACTDTEIVYSAKGRICNNMLYERYVHSTKGQAYSYETNPSSRQRGCYIRTMTARVQLRNNISSGTRGVWRQNEVFGAKPPVVKVTLTLILTLTLTLSCWLSQLTVVVVRSVKWEAGSWGRGEFGNPEEEERPPLEAATKQRLGKTEKTLCVL
jgi:hypothetical protein